MGRIATYIIIIIAVILAYLITANIKGWWPYSGDELAPTPSPTVTVAPTPTSKVTPSPKATSTPKLSPSPTPSITPKTSASPTPNTTPTPVPGYSQRIIDGLPTYELYVPATWKIRAQEGYRRKQISYQEVASTDFSSHTDYSGTKIYYGTGALLIINVVSGTYPAPTLPDPRVAGGTLLQYYRTANGRTYLLTFAYNPSTLSDGSQIFDTIVASFKIY